MEKHAIESMELFYHSLAREYVHELLRTGTEMVVVVKAIERTIRRGMVARVKGGTAEFA